MTTTIEEERERIRLARAKGTTCGACGAFVKVYPRVFDSAQAVALLALLGYLRKHGENPLDPFDAVGILRKLAVRDRDLGLLAARGLLRVVGFERKGRRSPYVFTTTGLLFAEGGVKIRSHALFFRGEVLDYSGEPISVREALGRSFDYEALIRGDGLSTAIAAAIEKRAAR